MKGTTECEDGSNVVTDRWNVPFLSATRGQKRKHVMAEVTFDLLAITRRIDLHFIEWH